MGTDLILACKSKGRRPERRAPVISAGDLKPASAAGESAAARDSCPPPEILERLSGEPSTSSKAPGRSGARKEVDSQQRLFAARPTLTPATPARRSPSSASNTAEVAAAQCPSRSAARRALFTVFAVRSAVGRPPRERAIPRANAGRSQATPSYVRRLLWLVKCPVSPLQPRPATPGR